MKENNMTSQADFSHIDKMEFEDALRELEEIVKTLEEGKPSLKTSVDLYERGVLLKKRCDKILELVQLRISQISSDKNGAVSIQPMEVET